MIRLSEWWEQGAFMDIEGSRIFTRVEGEGPTLIFLHGFPTSSHDWAEVFLDLARDHRCVTFDYLGYGASDKPGVADYSSITQTSRALKILQHLGVTEGTVIAHDLGGILLQQLLYRSVEGRTGLAIDHAVFSNSSVFPDLYRPAPTQLALVDPEQGRQIARGINRPMMEASLAAMFPTQMPSTERIADLWEAISREDGQLLWPDQLVYMRERTEQGSAWVDAMHQTSSALSFIYGLADEISGAQILARAKTDLSGAECIGLDGLGHYPQVEAPVAYTKALRSALAHQSVRA